MYKFKPPFKSIGESSQPLIGSQMNRSTNGFDSSFSQNMNNNSAENQSMSEFNRILSNIKTENQSNESEMFENNETNIECQLISSDGTKLRSVQELPHKYRSVFKEFPHFNVVQSKVFDSVLYTDKSIAICAPTGSGKTVVFELAIIRQMMNFEANGLQLNTLKAIYMAPLKVLVSEKYREWNKKFTPLGLKCIQLTGDSYIEDYEQLNEVNIVLTTPEKWDSTIRNNENKSLIVKTQLMLIDEVHLIHDDSRGATMEAVISRMKTLQSIKSRTENEANLRFIAVSATAPNVEDIAQWLDPNNSIGYKMPLDLRSVRLQKIVMGFPCNQNWTDFRFDIQLSFKLDSIIKNYCDSKPTLIFCSTRKSVELTAKTLAKSYLMFFFSQNQKMSLLSNISQLKCNELKNSLQKGIGFHHSGLDMNDRNAIERLFSNHLIPVLISTTTLSMGVNLPAHLVIIKNTTQYSSNSCHEYPETQILQMIGRAGRPQFDSSATAIIMTKEQNKTKYEQLLNGLQTIESNLHKNLVEQLNAEIAMQTVTSISIAVDWVRSTFLFIRVLKNPTYYGSDISDSSEEKAIEKVHEWCHKELIGLENSEMISTDPQFSRISSTALGKIMAKNCVSLKTMKMFIEMTEQELSLKEMIREISKCYEIVQEVQLRVSEKKHLNETNQTIRFPISGKIKTADMKINCLIQSVFGTLVISETSLIQDSLKIMRSGQRITKCLLEIMYFRHKHNQKQINYKSLLNSVILNKCFKAKLWHDSNHVAKQLNKIGIQLSKVLVDKGIKSFNDIKNANPRDLEFYMKRNPPFGTQLIEEVKHLPYYSMTIKQEFDKGLKRSEAKIKITVKLENFSNLREKRILFQSHTCFLIVGNDENDLFFCHKVFDSTLMKNNGIFEKNDIIIKRNERNEYINAHLISDSFVGLDVESKLKPQFLGEMNSDTNDVNTSIAFSDTLIQINAINNIESCQHKCQNKMSCGHNCCKKGLNLESKNGSNKRNELESAKQVTKNKRQQNTTETTKKAKPEVKKINDLTDWLIKNPIKTDENPVISDKNDEKEKSEYFENKMYSEILDNDIEFDFDDDFDDKVSQLVFCSEDFQFDAKNDENVLIDNNSENKPKEKSIGNEFESFSMNRWSLFIPFNQIEGKIPFIPHQRKYN